MRNREITAFRDKEIRTMTQYVFRFCNVLYTISIYFPIPTIKGGSVILFFFFLIFTHSFIWLCLGLVVICRISDCGMQALVPWPGIESVSPVLGLWSLSHWTTKEVHWFSVLQPQKVSKASLSVNIHVGRNLDPHIHEQFLNSSKVFHLILPREGI